MIIKKKRQLISSKVILALKYIFSYCVILKSATIMQLNSAYQTVKLEF